MNEGWAALIATIVSGVIGGAVAWLSRRSDKAHQLPSDFEQRMVNQRKEYEELLEKKAEALEEEVVDLQHTRDECLEKLGIETEERKRLQRKVDDLSATVTRLNLRLTEVENPHGV